MTIDDITTFAPAVFGSGLLALVFGYLWTVYREPALALWTAAWVLWAIRRGIALVSGSLQFVELPLPVVLLVSAYLSLMLLGTARFTGRRVAGPWTVLLVVTIAGVVGTAGTPWEEAGRTAFAAIVAIGWAWAGLLFLAGGRGLGRERVIPGVALVLMGGTNLLLPLVAGSADDRAWGTALVFGLQTTIAIGILAVFLARNRRDQNHALHEAEMALTRTLADYLPVCARCRDVREGASWTPLEEYLDSRTGADVARTLCPSCRGTAGDAGPVVAS